MAVPGFLGGIIGGFLAFLVGSAIAGATFFGLVSAQTGPPDQSPTSVNEVGIDPTSYGSTE